MNMGAIQPSGIKRPVLRAYFLKIFSTAMYAIGWRYRNYWVDIEVCCNPSLRYLTGRMKTDEITAV